MGLTSMGSGGPERPGGPTPFPWRTWLPGQACTKQGWLRSWSIRQLPPGRGGRSCSRRWKVKPRPQLRLQPLQLDQGVSTQSTEETGWGDSEGGHGGVGPLGVSPVWAAHTTVVLI